ncbi:disease resistance protein RGA2-like [Salvia hispanica]|uniref:disease resistance protein RGA2-like n=1 Tax=Salvia hispanica TaxID=49212 RepID=UPI0020098C4D|nr:disease resistance protein RGA2-like [Salvia hispanica]
MEGEAVAAVLQVLVQNLIDHSKEGYLLVQGLKKEADKLKGSLDTIQKYLNDAEKRTNLNDALKSWLKRLENVAFDADNVLDELKYRDLIKQIKPIKPMKQKVLSCFSPCVKFSRSRSMAVKIKEINENLESIYKEGDGLGLREILTTDVPTLPDPARETDCVTLDPIFIGRDKVTSEIVEKLTDFITTDERVASIVAIVGMGGLGKTTLTRKVFNLLQEKNLFGSHIWVHVSQNFDPMALLKKVLKELASHRVEADMSRQDIMKNLEEELKEKTYLLIFDDVWNQELSKWDDFLNSLLGATSTKGNAIVVTTRSMEVASTVSALYTHKLEGLSKEDCWSIIKERTFGKEEVPLGLEAIGTEIAGKCQGLPLAAIVVGGVLRNKSEEKWISIKEQGFARNGGDHITNILRLSYDELSVPSLKKCFAYCSTFPKGHGFRKHELIEYWMAEGFLEAGEDNDLEFVGENFFNILLDNSLLEIARSYNDWVECVMHDLVHDLAYSVLGGSHNASDIFPVRYMFTEEKSKDVLKKNAKYLRTLLVMDNICGNMFSEFKCLHVLTFGSDGVIELSSSIRKLIHLRVLNINGSRIECLPDWIGELVHLQTLRAEISYLAQLPSTLKYLINLRHLCIRESVDLPVEMGLLTSLRTLEHFKVGDKSGYKIEELGSLNDLIGKLEISKLEKWDWNREGETTNDEDVLEGLLPHSNLKKLWIHGFKGKRFPSWSPDMAVENVPRGSWVQLNNLIKISLIDCSECEEIPMFGHLPNLKSLHLFKLSNVKSINSFAHESECIVFPALEKFVLRNMPRLTEWVHTEWLFDRNPNLLNLFFWSPLKELTFRENGSNRPLANIFETKLTLLTELFIEGIDDLECLPKWLFDRNPNLLVLAIVECPNLRGLPDGLCSINSLEHLVIIKCPNLEYMGAQQSQGSLTCLKELTIMYCNALLYLPCELLGSSLEKLWLKNLSCLKNVPEIIDCLPKLSHLSWLTILGVPQFSADNYNDSLELDFSVMGSMETVDGILQGCNFPPIKKLKLKGWEGWESLPESIQSLTALQKLTLENFGMEELPDWLGNLSDLWRLNISNCKKLRRLPMDVIRCIANLEYLHISECPGVRFDISQWPYISHIFNIDIDGQQVVSIYDDDADREELWINFLEQKQSQNSYGEEAEAEAIDEEEESESEVESESEEESEKKLKGERICV